MQPSEDNNPDPLPFSSELNEKASTNMNSEDKSQHHPQEIELQLKRSKSDGQDPNLNLFLGSIPHNPLYTQTASGYQPIYQPISMSTENSQQNLVHHIEDDVPLPKQPEPPRNHKPKAKRPRKWCFKKQDPYSYLGDTIETIDNILFIIFLIFVFGILALLIALRVYHSRKTDAKLTPVAGALSYMAFNLASHPILDIKVQDNSIDCPEDYYPLVLGTWPGTAPGCLL